MNTREAQGCEWSEDETYGSFETSCGIVWEFSEGLIGENGIKYCPFCGKKIKQSKV